MNTIKTRTYDGNLYRADKTTFYPQGKASVNYKNAPMKYFTLNKKETNIYTRHGKPYVKTWKTTDSLKLIDILDLKTRKVLDNIPNLKESITVAFPIKNGKVMRVSEEDTQHHDDNVLIAICELGYDGYYMETLKNMGFKFHSEVGLCPRAFDKLELMSSKLEAPPEMKKKAKVRTLRNNNNRNNNRNNSTRRNKQKNMSRRPLFSMNESNSNNANNTNNFIKRPLF